MDFREEVGSNTIGKMGQWRLLMRIRGVERARQLERTVLLKDTRPIHTSREKLDVTSSASPVKSLLLEGTL